MRHIILSGLLLLSTFAASPATAQRLELTPMTAEQRWDRASKNMTLFTMMYMHEGMKAGKLPVQIGRELAEFLGPWPNVATPVDLARTIYRNWQLWREVDFVATQTPDSTIAITSSRPYVSAIQQYNVIGVTSADFDAMFGAFHQAIAQRQGLEFRQVVDSMSVRMTIRRPK